MGGSTQLFRGIAELLLETYETSGIVPTWVLLSPATGLRFVIDRETDTTAGSFINGPAWALVQQVLGSIRFAISAAVPNDKVIVGSPEAATLFRHTSGVEVRSSTGYGTFYGAGLVAVRGKMRSALVLETPSGIGVLTLGS